MALTLAAAERPDEMFRLVVEAAPNAMLMVDDRGILTYVNRQAEQLFGYSRDEMVGQTVEMLVPEKHRGNHPARRAGYQATPSTRAMGAGRDLHGLTKDGREVPIEIGLNPIAAGGKTWVLASIIDITERKRAEALARGSDQRFRQMVSAVKDYGFLMLDRDGRVVSWNDGTRRLKGYTEQEALGQHHSLFYPAEDVLAGKPERDLRLALENGRFEDECWRVRKDGSRFWGSMLLTPVHDEHGELQGYAKVTRDMTEGRRSAELFRQVVEAAPNAMLMVSRAGEITLVNRQAEKLFGYARSELLGKAIEMLVPMRARAQHPARRDGYFAAPATRSMGVGRDLFGLTRDGREVPVEIGLNPIDTADGAQVLASVIDITERKRSEDALLQSEKMASLGSLVAGVAHEINTPVGVGVTAASHLADEVKGLKRAAANGTMTRAMFDSALDALGQSADILQMNLQRAAELIRSFKQVAVDQTNQERRRLDLKAYIEEVLRSLTPKLKATQIRISLDCPEPISVETVPGALSQVITNLFMNALIHAFEPGAKGHLKIGLHRAGAATELTFEDDGKGITAENLSHIFDPFFTTRRGQGGTGLGLHIVYNLVHRTLGGSIAATSEPGRGTRFTMTF